MKKFLCLLIVLTILLSFSGCTKKAVAAMEEQIAALGTITLDSGDAIAAAEEAMAALNGKDRLAVTNKQILTNARAQYQNLLAEKQADDLEVIIHDLRPITFKSEPDLLNADKLYNEADVDVKTRVENFYDLVTAFQFYQNLHVSRIERYIRAIGQVTADSGPAIEEARKFYDEATEDVQILVYNYRTLMEAEKAFEELQHAEEPAEEK